MPETFDMPVWILLRESVTCTSFRVVVLDAGLKFPCFLAVKATLSV